MITATEALEMAQTVARQDDEAHTEAIREGMEPTAEDAERHLAAIATVDELAPAISTLRSELRARR